MDSLHPRTLIRTSVYTVICITLRNVNILIYQSDFAQAACSIHTFLTKILVNHWSATRSNVESLPENELFADNLILLSELEIIFFKEKQIFNIIICVI